MKKKMARGFLKKNTLAIKKAIYAVLGQEHRKTRSFGFRINLSSWGR